MMTDTLNACKEELKLDEVIAAGSDDKAFSDSITDGGGILYPVVSVETEVPLSMKEPRKSKSSGAVLDQPESFNADGGLSGVPIRRARRRCRRHRQTASCSHSRQLYEHDRYAVLFEKGPKDKRPISPEYSVAKDLRFGSGELESLNMAAISKYPVLDPRAQLPVCAMFDLVYDSETDTWRTQESLAGNLARASSDDDADSLERLDALAFLDPNTTNPNYVEMFGGPMDHLILGAGRRVVAEVYPRGTKIYAECKICLLWTDLNERPCCGFHVCKPCLVIYFETQVSMANVKITCIGTDCSVAIHRDEILALLDDQFRTKYNQFLVDANKDPRSKTCPRCSHVMVVENIAALMANPQARNFGHRVECPACSLVWCFPCQAPWHEPIKCKLYQRGDKLLKNWAKEQHYGQANAQKCPKCKVYIQRSSGCDHMTCSRCKTNFCYRCGEQFRELKFIGNHYSKLSIFGCKYRFLPDNPVRRKLIRGSIFGGKLLAAPVIGGLAVGAGAVVVGVGALVLPVYGVYKLHKKLQQRKRAKRQRRARDEMFRKLEEMQKRGEELDISNPITNTDIIEEIEASRVDSLHHSVINSLFFSATDDDDDDDNDDDDDVYVARVRQSSYVSSDSSVEIENTMSYLNKSCQTSHIGGLNQEKEVSSSRKGEWVREKGFTRRKGIVETHSMPHLEVCGRPPSPAYFMFTHLKIDGQKSVEEEAEGAAACGKVSVENSAQIKEEDRMGDDLFHINIDDCDSDCEEFCEACGSPVPQLVYCEDYGEAATSSKHLGNSVDTHGCGQSEHENISLSFREFSKISDKSAYKGKSLSTERHKDVADRNKLHAPGVSKTKTEKGSKKEKTKERRSSPVPSLSAKIFPSEDVTDLVTIEGKISEADKDETQKHSVEESSKVVVDQTAEKEDCGKCEKADGDSCSFVLPCDFVIHL